MSPTASAYLLVSFCVSIQETPPSVIGRPRAPLFSLHQARRWVRSVPATWLFGSERLVVKEPRH
jgi:hypothetical protein